MANSLSYLDKSTFGFNLSEFLPTLNTVINFSGTKTSSIFGRATGYKSK